MVSIETIAMELKKRFLESDKDNKCTITMKADGNQLSLTLCSDNTDLVLRNANQSIFDFDYILVSGNGSANWMSGTPEQVCRQLANYKALNLHYAQEVELLRNYFETNKDDSDVSGEKFEWYSDWHKDVFGYRPIGWTFNIRNK